MSDSDLPDFYEAHAALSAKVAQFLNEFSATPRAAFLPSRWKLIRVPNSLFGSHVNEGAVVRLKDLSSLENLQIFFMDIESPMVGIMI